MEKKIVIIGAGPTGLGAGYRLSELGYNNYHIYESKSELGGLAGSYQDSAGFTWDVGGHVMFSHYPYYDDVFNKLMGSDFQENMRECWLRLFNRWIPYPFQNNIRYLPKEVACECLIGLIEAQTQRSPSAATNFQQFVDAVFGDGIAKHFMNPYNFKVWAHPLSMMNKEWIGERVAVIDIERAIQNVILERDDVAWGPNNMFKFPLFGGTGEFYRRFAPALDGHVHLNTRVVSVNPHRKELRFASGETTRYDVLISTIPLDKLCNKVMTGVHEEIELATSQLRHSGGYMVGIGIERPCPSTKSWMYFPEANCPFYRVTYLSNYSPFMTPDKDRYHSLLCETSYSEFKPVDGESIVDDTIDGLIKAGLLEEADRERVVDTWCYNAAYSYPTPTKERDSILAEAIPYLEGMDVYSRGRFGMWKYEVSNTDHSLMQGVELVNRLLQDEPETTIGIKYESTDDGRRAASHERSVVAGSGDPRKAMLPRRAFTLTAEDHDPREVAAHSNGHTKTKDGAKLV